MAQMPMLTSIQHMTIGTIRPGPALPSYLTFSATGQLGDAYKVINENTGQAVNRFQTPYFTGYGPQQTSAVDVDAGVTQSGLYGFHVLDITTDQVSPTVQVQFGTVGADTLNGPTLGPTMTGPTHLFGSVRNPDDEVLGVRAGHDTFIAYTVAPDVDGEHATGAEIWIGGNSSLDTVVLPVALGDLVGHSRGSLPGRHLTIETADATVRIDAIERLQFSDVTLSVQSDPLVDFLHYDGRYADVASLDLNVRAHYDSYGWHEGRDPNALFSTLGYLGAYGDVHEAGFNPLNHYDASGWKEGRHPSAAFDTKLYLTFNPDVARSGMDPLVHYLNFGMEEGRKMSPVMESTLVKDGFDPLYYKLANSDVGLSGMDTLTHYEVFGAKEGRNPDAFFDTNWYLAHNADVRAAGIGALAHYNAFGWKEGRDPSTHFDTGAYLAANPDVAASGMSPLQHFLQFGAAEGRSGFGDLY